MRYCGYRWLFQIALPTIDRTQSCRARLVFQKMLLSRLGFGRSVGVGCAFSIVAKVGVICLYWSYWQAALKVRDEEDGSTARSSPAAVAEDTKAKPAMIAGVQETSAPQVLAHA